MRFLLDVGTSTGRAVSDQVGVDSRSRRADRVDDLDDDVLVRCARDGDVHAYEQLIRRYAPIAHRTAVLLARR
jgi:hypothetical protein